MKLSALAPNSMNPRKISKEKLSMLKKTLAEFGDLGGIVYNRRTKQLVGGHQRSRAIPEEAEIVLEIKYKTPTRTGTIAEGYVEHEGERFRYRAVDWDITKEKAANIAANKNAGEWDHDILSELIREIDEFGFDLDLTMFSAEEIADQFPGVVKVEGYERTGPTGADQDDVPEQVEPRTKLGDVYQLGKHRLMCGDATSSEAVELLMGKEKADMVFTDPPYGISLGFESKEQAKARNRRTDGLKVENDNLQGEDLQTFLTDALSMADLSLKNGGAFYVCSPIDAKVRKFITAIESVGWHYQSGLVWNKSSLSLSRHDYHPKHEIIHYGWKSGAAHTWIADRKQTTVFDFDKPSRSELHPTTKPVELVEYYIGNVVEKGTLVLDLFGGSGTTLIACEKTNRQCRMMELDPHYCDVIVTRWEKFTGQKAELLTGPKPQKVTKIKKKTRLVEVRAES